MVTKEEMENKKFLKEDNKVAVRVTAPEMKKFNAAIELTERVGEIIGDYVDEHNLKPKYEKLSELLQMNEKTIKSNISGKNNIQRTFLYKLCVGLHMTIEQANELFEMCGGKLKEDCCEDYICKCALRDGDDIKSFIEDYNKYSENSKLKTLQY